MMIIITINSSMKNNISILSWKFALLKENSNNYQIDKVIVIINAKATQIK